MRISQRTGEVLIIIAVIVLNLWLMSSGWTGGRYQYDYHGDVQEQNNP